MSSASLVWVLDTSAIIFLLDELPEDDAAAKACADHLSAMAEAGVLTYPKIVVDELERRTPGLPYRWARGNLGRLQFSDPPFEVIREVMASPAARVVDPNKEREDGDPHVLAEALHLRKQGYAVRVVTNDIWPKGSHISMVDACRHLELEWCLPANFPYVSGHGAGSV